MMMQLNPMIPMHVIGKGDGHAFAMIDYSQEHNLMFVVAIDSTGEVWTVSNMHVRFLKNITMDRILDKNQSNDTK
jgi:hypothetical protein